MDAEQRARASRAVQARMTELALSVQQVARAAGVSPNTVRSLLRGDRWPNTASRHSIEVALDWRPGELTGRALNGPITATTSALAGYSDHAIALEHLRRTRPNYRPDGEMAAFTDRDLALEWLKRINTRTSTNTNRANSDTA